MGRLLSGAAVVALVAGLSPTSASAQDDARRVGEMVLTEEDIARQEQGTFSPYAGRNFAERPLWGDTHLHTSNSLDARAFGALLDPETAYRFARGEEVTSSHGLRVRLSRPLDWLVIADHSDALGAMNEIVAGDAALMRDATIADWNRRLNEGGNTALRATMDVISAFSAGNVPAVINDPRFVQSVWGEYVETADAFNDPGTFTTIVGYEWTPTEGGNNLHRNVLYRDGGERARRVLPFTTAESFNPEDLWRWMENYEEVTGGRVLALAHNGNLSNGIMFPVETNPETGEPLTAAYAEVRARWEPLYEVTQIKGDGEAHPFLSPNDEFADYETWDASNLGPVPKEPWMLQYEYAREALKNGLRLEESLGTNPYKFGMVGSTDSHTGLATAEEENFFGKHSGVEPEPGRWEHVVGEFETTRVLGWEQAASGYAAVWAEENTREAIFDAMDRKEVYATTGSRIAVRFFGGWNFVEGDALTRLPAEVGYGKGVPMGGDLPARPEGAAAPTFLVAAMKDPFGGNLDRIQIVKGWLGADGATQEKVYDVVWGGDRKPGADGRLPPIGDTVDVATATFNNSIGAPELITVWEDPDFDPAERAFYYARVIEIPTPRWTAYDAVRFGVEMSPEVPMTTQERAYTSPIWYTP
ncbi:DUF3604 domain-containing protein [Paracoccus benzoatiresistens]|uniref:DUF3604 domain-containing protein n=1 Tax=Paracoccus benzoatiresistens TaxID=2997341 RepID=A0ABT4JB64_9RHOB|nr:DUF3604 domain-containing protein [Paracoccus sp. EF6]MCZ0964371.1 DUF3604 domain-containing protein [Paracoccus sp. EF6]